MACLISLIRNHIYWIVGRSTNAVRTGTTAIYGVVLTCDKLAAKVSFARFMKNKTYTQKSKMCVSQYASECGARVRVELRSTERCGRDSEGEGFNYQLDR